MAPLLSSVMRMLLVFVFRGDLICLARFIFNCSRQSRQRLRVVKEEDRFIKELGLIEDIFVESRTSSLN